MATVKRTRRAEQDLIEIWLHIAADNPAAADALLIHLDDVSHNLAAEPRMGAKRSDIAPSLRLWPTGSYVILYQEIEGGVEVLRYVHGARDLPNLTP